MELVTTTKTCSWIMISSVMVILRSCFNVWDSLASTNSSFVYRDFKTLANSGKSHVHFLQTHKKFDSCCINTLQNLILFESWSSWRKADIHICNLWLHHGTAALRLLRRNFFLKPKPGREYGHCPNANSENPRRACSTRKGKKKRCHASLVPRPVHVPWGQGRVRSWRPQWGANILHTLAVLRGARTGRT
jgi:hypothetical protein